jgi:sterol 14-demethylase
MNHVSFFWPTAPTAKHKARDIARGKIAALFTVAIEERRQGKFHDDDFLQLLVDSKYQDGTSNTTEQIIGMLLAALFAGQHTSSITSTWTGIEILRNPKLIPRLLEEQEHIMSKYHDDITLDSLAEMDLLNACMKETLRMHPPLVVLLRKVKVDQEYRGFKIPAGEIIAVSPPVAHQLEDVFKDAGKYNPDRFVGQEPEGLTKFSFIAFGGGRHGCLGERFAFLQVKTIWSTLLRNFEFELVDKNPVPDFENIVSGPKPPCVVRYRRKVFRAEAANAALSNLI